MSDMDPPHKSWAAGTYDAPAPVVRETMEDTFDKIRAELVHARTKFPYATHLTVALMGEVGELAKDILEGNWELARVEAAQVAAVAIRIIEEGDHDFGMPKKVLRNR